MRIVLADSQALVRAGLRRLLAEQGAAHIVGEASDGRQLLELCGRLRPEVVLTEIDLPQLSGIEALIQIRRRYPDIAVVVLTSLTHGQHVRNALHAGAAGFIAKDAEPAELGLALAAVARHRIYLSPSLSHCALAMQPAPRVEDDAQLTPRQRQVLQLIAIGKSTREIAGLMGVGIKTVETHRARLMQSLGLYGTNALMRHAIRQGLDYA